MASKCANTELLKQSIGKELQIKDEVTLYNTDQMDGDFAGGSMLSTLIRPLGAKGIVQLCHPNDGLVEVKWIIGGKCWSYLIARFIKPEPPKPESQLSQIETLIID